MKKEYIKPEIRFVAMSKSPFMTMSPVVIGGTNLNGEDESEELIPTGNSNTNTGIEQPKSAIPGKGHRKEGNTKIYYENN